MEMASAANGGDVSKCKPLNMNKVAKQPKVNLPVVKPQVRERAQVYQPKGPANLDNIVIDTFDL